MARVLVRRNEIGGVLTRTPSNLGRSAKSGWRPGSRPASVVLPCRMADLKAPTNLEELVDRVDDSANQSEKVKLRVLMDRVGRRSFGPLLLFAGVIMATPIISDIPGVSTTLGIFILIVAVQVIFGRDCFWIPKWLLNRGVSSAKLKKASAKWIRPVAKFVDRFIHERIRLFVGPWGSRLIAIASTVLAFGTPLTEVIPFSQYAVGGCITLFGLALIARDGLLALFGWIAFATIVVLAIHGMR